MTVLAKIEKVLDEVRLVENGPIGDWKVYLAYQNQLWEKIDLIDKQAGPGLNIGRLVYWQFGDGYAYYFVAAFSARKVTLLHIPIGDAWEIPFVPANGKIERAVIENRLRQIEAISTIHTSATNSVPLGADFQVLA